MKTATIDDLLSWKPCYDEAKICAWANGRTSFNALDVLQHPDVSAQDKLWVVLRPEMLDARTARLFACDCAEHVLHLFERDYPNDTRPRAAIDVSRRFANGDATAAELDAARAAAWAAAWDAARAAAWDAARAAAWDAAWDAARDAARDAERRWQIQHLTAMVQQSPTPASTPADARVIKEGE